MLEKFLRCLTMVGILCGPCNAAPTSEPKNDRGHRGGPTGSFNVSVPAHPFDLILARPEKNAVTLSVLAYEDMDAFVVYGTQSGTRTTPVQQFRKNLPTELILGGLQPDTAYFYQFRYRSAGTGQFAVSPEYTFHTAPPPGSSFTFTLTADAHLDEHTAPNVYLKTLANIASEKPDFHIDLGNLFMTDKHASRDEAAKQYVAQRYYLGQIGSFTPVFLAIGTHDGESAKDDDGTEDCLAVWSNLLRTRCFPNPFPDAFYTGNSTHDRRTGLLEDYYAWQWGDALFIVLDPFRFSDRGRGSGDGWDWSLGWTQYKWLKQTLEQSRAGYKFVFIHNLLSGDRTARGGTEVAGFNEWGGRNADGSPGFKEHRPGWDVPVHELLVQNHVTVLFKAHDNFYARQELDGINYLMVPQPSFAGDDRIRDLQTYGYKIGKFIGNTGHVRVTVTPGDVKIDYIRTYLPEDETVQQKNGEIADEFYIKPYYYSLH